MLKQKTLATIPTSALCAALLGALVGCGSDSSDDVSDSAKNLTREPSLQGAWVSTCDTAKPLEASAKATFRFGPLRYEKSILLFKDGGCTQELAKAVYRGEFKIGRATDLKEGLNRIDLNPKTLAITASTQAGVDALNLINLCGITDWALGQERDVTAGAADGKCLTERINQTQYDVYRLEEKKLTFGSIFVFGAPVQIDKRPTDIGNKVFVLAK